MSGQPKLIRPEDLPLHGGFSGHETFPFRYAWLPKGIQALDSRPDIFSAEDAMVVLGVGKNMVRSIRHWCLATGVAMERDPLPGTRTRLLEPSPIGRQMFLSGGEFDDGWDPYLEDDSTLWVLHWHLATNRSRATSWYWAFSHFKEPEFTREGMVESLRRLVETYNWVRISDASLNNDISCFLRTYAPGKRGPTSTAEDSLDCPLTGLRLLINLGGNRFRFNNSEKPNLNAAVFIYALVDFWINRHPHQNTLSLHEIAHGEASPGKVFCLTDDTVLRYLDEIVPLTRRRLEFSDTAITRQVIRHSKIEPKEVLDDYFRG